MTPLCRSRKVILLALICGYGAFVLPAAAVESCPSTKASSAPIQQPVQSPDLMFLTHQDAPLVENLWNAMKGRNAGLLSARRRLLTGGCTESQVEDIFDSIFHLTLRHCTIETHAIALTESDLERSYPVQGKKTPAYLLPQRAKSSRAKAGLQIDSYGIPSMLRNKSVRTIESECNDLIKAYCTFKESCKRSSHVCKELTSLVGADAVNDLTVQILKLGSAGPEISTQSVHALPRTVYRTTLTHLDIGKLIDLWKQASTHDRRLLAIRQQLIDAGWSEEKLAFYFDDAFTDEWHKHYIPYGGGIGMALTLPNLEPTYPLPGRNEPAWQTLAKSQHDPYGPTTAVRAVSVYPVPSQSTVSAIADELISFYCAYKKTLEAIARQSKVTGAGDDQVPEELRKNRQEYRDILVALVGEASIDDLDQWLPSQLERHR